MAISPRCFLSHPAWAGWNKCYRMYSIAKKSLQQLKDSIWLWGVLLIAFIGGCIYLFRVFPYVLPIVAIVSFIITVMMKFSDLNKKISISPSRQELRKTLLLIAIWASFFGFLTINVVEKDFAIRNHFHFQTIEQEVETENGSGIDEYIEYNSKNLRIAISYLCYFYALLLAIIILVSFLEYSELNNKSLTSKN